VTLLMLRDVTVRRGRRAVLDGVSAAVDGGELVGLLGPNGSGKTTLMRAALGLLPAEGAIALGGAALGTLAARGRALRVSYIPQERSIAWAISVETLVGLGRTPHRATTAADRAAVEKALLAMELDSLRERPATTLSGGERARVLIARALAQDAPLLLADEPTAGLDPAHALTLMAAFRGLATGGRGVLVSIHDLGLAARWCDRLLLLDHGRLAADGPPEAVLTAERLAAVYGITAHIGRDASGPILQPTGLAEA
jgi:iron complex transport system ATP-binding protein